MYSRLVKRFRSACLAVPIVLLLSACQFAAERSLPDGYAAWSDVDVDGTWTLAAERAVAGTSLARQSPSDMWMFCPRYAELDADSRVRVWVTLLSAMAKFESNFDPRTAFTETITDSEGNRVVSRGLLQLSIESANQQRYGCSIRDASDLHDPATNLTCGARILSTWVEADGVVAHTDSGTRGGARYWSVLRSSNRDRARIRDTTRSLGICASTG